MKMSRGGERGVATEQKPLRCGVRFRADDDDDGDDEHDGGVDGDVGPSSPGGGSRRPASRRRGRGGASDLSMFSV